jgi:hypothetical protein
MSQAMSAGSMVIQPQDGPQTAFAQSPADVAVYGGSAGAGKSWSLLIEPLRHIANGGFRCVIFRRTFPEINSSGGLWDESSTIYPQFGGKPNKSDFRWTFDTGAVVEFRHLQRESDIYQYQGAQYTLIGWDELTHFSPKMFWYLLSRNRSTCGVTPYVRATCNPDAGSFVADLVKWWIDPETGYPIEERSGIVRWFARIGEDIVWFDTQEEGPHDKSGRPMSKSFTFIPAKLSDNKILEEQDPGYRANLEAQTKVERDRLLGGNWFTVDDSESEWGREYFDDVFVEPEEVPGGRQLRIMSIDASKGKESKVHDDSAIVGATITESLIYCDAVAGRWNPNDLVSQIFDFAEHFHPNIIRLEVNAFQSLLLVEIANEAKRREDSWMTNWLRAGNNIEEVWNTEPKVVRIRRLSRYVTGRILRFVNGRQAARTLVLQLREFPQAETDRTKHDDLADALATALCKQPTKAEEKARKQLRR